MTFLPLFNTMKISKHSHGAEGTYRESFFFVAKVLDLSNRADFYAYYDIIFVNNGGSMISGAERISSTEEDVQVSAKNTH